MRGTGQAPEDWGQRRPGAHRRGLPGFVTGPRSCRGPLCSCSRSHFSSPPPFPPAWPQMDARCQPEFLPRAATQVSQRQPLLQGQGHWAPLSLNGAREPRAAGGRGCSQVPPPSPDSCPGSLEPLGAGWSRTASWTLSTAPSRELGRGRGAQKESPQDDTRNRAGAEPCGCICPLLLLCSDPIESNIRNCP